MSTTKSRSVGVVLHASSLALLLASWSCQSPSPPSGANGDPVAEPSPTSTEKASPTDPTAVPVPATLKSPNLTTADGRITPSTRRTAAGLPEPLPDYASWTLRQPLPPKTVAGDSPHLAERQAYVYFPQGEPENPPQSSGVILLIEEKQPGTDFITQVCALEKTEAGWKPTAFSRTAAAAPFTTIATTSCGACHQ